MEIWMKEMKIKAASNEI